MGCWEGEWVGGRVSGLVGDELTSCPLLQTEKDISVRQKAIDLLYAMCDNSNSVAIVAELLRYLETADYSIRETLVSRFRAVR